MPLLTASELKVSYGEVDIFSEVSLEVAEADRIGVVGPNGGGKTSLVMLLVGQQEPTAGQVHRSSGLRIGYVPQTSRPATDGTIRDEVMVAFKDIVQLEDDIATAARELERAGDESRRNAERQYSTLLARYENLGGYDYVNYLERVTDGVGLDEQTLSNAAASASGGERTRAALARALLADPDLLVLDEPTNYLDFKGLDWLEKFLNSSRRAFVVVSHDRFFLDATAKRIWDLDNGRLHAYNGGYTQYRVQKAEQQIRQSKEYERQQEFIAKELDFIARYHAGQRAKEAKGREKRLARLERIDAPDASERAIRLASASVSRGPRVVVSASGLGVGFAEGGGSELISLQDVKLLRGSRTVVIGSNGTGKTTLLQTILGERPPMSGEVKIGEKVTVGYHRQGADGLPEMATVLGAMQEIRNIPPAEERDYLARFLFMGDDVFKEVRMLSGGERTRLSVARLLVEDPNFLVLDEPTTHLDIPSREALEIALDEYAGTLLFVSHDRHLISRLADQLLIVEGGAGYLFPGRFEEWAEQAGPAASTPGQSREETPARRRFGTPRKKPKGGAKSAVATRPQIDHERRIAGLETHLAEVEIELQSASERRDVERVAALGKEYDKTRLELERAWEEWGE
jgi:ATP-binding cassette subfamily F protein 3